MIRRGLVCLAMVLVAHGASGQIPSKPLDRLDRLDRPGTSEAAIAPIFSQLFLFSLPDEFRMAPGTTRRARFVQQAVLAKETPARWTQKITVSGDEAAAFGGRTWPQKMVDDFAAKMRKACPESFATLPFPGLFVASYDTAVAVVSCGSTPGAGGSESTLQLVVKGGMDVYTLEWAVRGAASRTPLKLDAAEWTDRIRRLGPVRICTIVQNEPPPYQSCLKRR